MADKQKTIRGIKATGEDSYIDKLQQALDKANIQTTNLSRPEYLQGVQTVNTYDPLQDFYNGIKTVNALGYVAAREPTQVNLNMGNMRDWQAPRVLAHEASHTQDMLASKRESDKKDTLLAVLGKDQGRELRSKYRNEIQNNFNTYVKNYGEKGGMGWAAFAANDLGTYWNQKNAPWDERLADLQALEAQLPKGQTLLDTELGKALFPTPELKQYWLTSAIPLAVKAIPRNDNPEPTLGMKFLSTLQDMQDTYNLEQRAGKSYADSAIEALKVLSPFYKDPFKDTTR